MIERRQGGRGGAGGPGTGFCAGSDLKEMRSATPRRLTEVGLGFFPPWGLEALVARVGISRTRLIVLAHEALDGARALEHSLAD
jgi:enoyl-CoA hydratase/carnithine racemase